MGWDGGDGRIDIIMDRKQALTLFCDTFEVDILYVLGSRAREVYDWLIGERESLTSHNSDVDIGVKGSRTYSVHDKVSMALALEALFTVARVDLVSLAEADPFLAINIIRGNRLYARDSYLADEYDLYVMRRAGDLAPFEHERIEMILSGKYKPSQPRIAGLSKADESG